LVCHVLNRAVGRATIFRDAADYAAFENLLLNAGKLAAVRLLTFCLMPNHWHLVLWPQDDGDLSAIAGKPGQESRGLALVRALGPTATPQELAEIRSRPHIFRKPARNRVLSDSPPSGHQTFFACRLVKKSIGSTLQLWSLPLSPTRSVPQTTP
jgi:REP element-mobilizing transposase RayT